MLSDEFIREMYKYYRDNHTLIETGKKFNRSHNTIAQLFRSRNLKIVDRRLNKTYSVYSLEELAFIKKHRFEGMTYKKLSIKFSAKFRTKSYNSMFYICAKKGYLTKKEYNEGIYK